MKYITLAFCVVSVQHVFGSEQPQDTVSRGLMALEGDVRRTLGTMIYTLPHLFSDDSALAQPLADCTRLYAEKLDILIKQYQEEMEAIMKKGT